MESERKVPNGRRAWFLVSENLPDDAQFDYCFKNVSGYEGRREWTEKDFDRPENFIAFRYAIRIEVIRMGRRWTFPGNNHSGGGVPASHEEEIKPTQRRLDAD